MTDKVFVGLNVSQYLMLALQANTVFWYIQLGLAILVSLVSIAYKIWKWYKEAYADGKITGEEVKQIIEEVKPDVEDIIDNVEEISKTDKN